jgi:hypothetical protein
MSAFWNRAPQTVRPRSSDRLPLTPCLLIFGLTAVTVYGLGSRNWTPTNPNPTFAATAQVVERSHEAGADSSEQRVPFTFRADKSAAAEAGANVQAEQFVRERRAEWAERTEGTWRKTRETVENARKEVGSCEKRLDEFRAELAARPQAVVLPHPAAKPAMVDNPKRLELNGRLSDLDGRYGSLLVDRTPLHPAVQDLAVRIDLVKEQMAAIPRQIAGKQAQTSPTTVENAPTADQIAKLDAEKLAALTAAVEKARVGLAAAESAERQAARLRQGGPRYSIERAEVVKIAPQVDYGWRRLIWTTLVTGALVAFGIGSVSAGAAIEPPVAGTAEIEMYTHVPVLGTIPADDPGLDAAAIHRQWRKRHIFAAAGFALILSGPVVAFWGIAGM